MSSEDLRGIDVAASPGVSCKPPFFSQIVPSGRRDRAAPIFQIESIAGVQGDIRRGRRPFPHPFPARMPIEVARAAVEALSSPGGMVLDPMIGSGVVAKAALALGRKAIGRDVDPLAVVQSQALCAIIDTSKLDSIAADVEKSARAILKSGRRVTTARNSLDDEGARFVDYWFYKRHADELFALSLAIDDQVSGVYWPIFAAIFSSLIISRGSGASRAMDLSRSRPHRVESKAPRLPLDLWSQQVGAFRKYYDGASLTQGADIRVGDARRLRLSDESVDAVITSPPYVNAIDYMRTSKFALVFLGSRLADLRKIRAGAIGTEVGLELGSLPGTLEADLIPRVADPRRRPLVRRYISDLYTALSESFRVLKPGGHALYVVGPSILSRRDYDAPDVLCNLARAVGFTPIGHARRDLSETRRSLPPPRRSKVANSINRRMTCEFYVLLSKEEG